MNLLQQIGRTQFRYAALVLVVAGSALFFVLDAIVTDEIDEQLALRADYLFAHLESAQAHPDPFVLIEPVAPATPPSVVGKDTVMYDALEDEMEPYRMLTVVRPVDGTVYRMRVIASRLAWEELLTSIFVIFLVMALLLTLGNAAVTTWSARRLWQPFFGFLEALRTFSLRAPAPLELPATPVTEFSELRTALLTLTQQVQADYTTLREFTENASHEIQTPLAILQAKLNRLSQHPAVDAAMADDIQVAREAADRLSRLGRSLLLLARLENQQFDTAQSVDLTGLLRKQLEGLEELFEARQVTLDISPLPHVVVSGNPLLLEMLLSNLLSNALRYTPPQGHVHLALTPDALTIANSGEVLALPIDELFQRFRKGNPESSSHGLGLAIVQEIARTHGWQIRYRREAALHTFRTTFRG